MKRLCDVTISFVNTLCYQVLNNYNSDKKKGYFKRKTNGKFMVNQGFYGKKKYHGTFAKESDAKALADKLKASKIEALLAAYETIDKLIENVFSNKL